MKSSSPSRALLPCVLLFLVTACADHLPNEPEQREPETVRLQELTCQVQVQSGRVECGGPPGAAGAVSGGARPLIVGGQGIYVRLTGTNVTYDGSTFAFDVTVQNLIPQALGTHDGSTLDSLGVRVAFHAGPTVTAGTGTVAVANEDGTGTFTGTGQPYFQYDELLSPGETSPVKRWELSVPSSVSTFSFRLYVSAAVRYPDGWVDVTPGEAALTTGDMQSVSAVVRDVVGRVVTGETVTYGSSDPEVATVDASGNVSAVADGTATISASSSNPARATGTVPLTVAPLRFTQVTAGGAHACGLTPEGWAYCWGANSEGELGDGTTTTPRSTPVRVKTSMVFASLSAGSGHTCGITPDGAAYCWGDDTYGKLGNGAPTADQTTPSAVSGGHVFAAIEVGDEFHTCGVTTAGVGLCWGYNNFGRLGDSTTTTRTVPTAVFGGHTFTSISAGYRHTCGVTTSNVALCWGTNGYGRLGDGTQTERIYPVTVSGGHAFASVTTGGQHSCGFNTAGAGLCWGDDGDGQLGDAVDGPNCALGGGYRACRTTPVAVSGGHEFSSLDAANSHSCGLSSAGQVLCWGRNEYGQLGDGTETRRDYPVAVSGGHTFTWVSAGGYGYNQASFACGVTTTGEAYCWGNNGSRQLGHGGTEAEVHVPTRVARQ